MQTIDKASIEQLRPPVAEQHPETLTAHDDVRVDPYYWLRDDERRNPEVLAYLEAENDYTDAVMASTAALQEQLFAELKSRLDPDDATVPVRQGDYWYYRRYQPDSEYPVYARRSDRDSGDEQVLLDVPVLAEPYEYYRIGSYEVSDSGEWLAYAEDTVSRRQYDIRFRNLNTDRQLPGVISNVSPAMAWSADNRHFYYVKLQEDTLIPHQVWRHRLGTPVADDVLVYEESDPTYYLSVRRSRDGGHIMLELSSTLQTETRLIPADDADAAPRVFLPRSSGHEYHVDLLGDTAYVLTNHQARNFQVMKVSLDRSQSVDAWTPFVAPQEATFIGDMMVFEGYLVTEETAAANVRLQVHPLDGGEAYPVQSADAAYAAELGDNPSTRSDNLRYTYSSLVTPSVVYEMDLATRQTRPLKKAFAGADFDPARYETARIEVTARDGTPVAVSLLYPAGAQPDGSHPLLLLGYGAYGAWYEPVFERDVLSLVDRGFVFAIGHIRGGQEHGRQWYEDGKLLNKKNTFNDFIDIGRQLKQLGWAHPQALVGMGRSAGGLLIGAVANQAPDTFDVLVTEVPFVDVVTTMLDESIPLTTFEYDEWGNPADRQYYDYMLSYSPYDQVGRQDYPHLLVMTGLWDSQVQYWEPAKWVAKLRAHQTGDHRLLLKTDMNAGHGGGSGRFERLQDRALAYAFILDTLKREGVSAEAAPAEP